MNLYEAIKLDKSVIKILYDAKFQTKDWKYIALYEEYLSLSNRGEKVSWIVKHLSTTYQTSERNVYKIIKRLQIPLQDFCSGI